MRPEDYEIALEEHEQRIEEEAAAFAREDRKAEKGDVGQALVATDWSDRTRAGLAGSTDLANGPSVVTSATPRLARADADAFARWAWGPQR